MNGVKTEDQVKYSQTSKGVWYCDGVTIYDEDLEKAVDRSDKILDKIEKVLQKHNGEVAPSKQEPSQSNK